MRFAFIPLSICMSLEILSRNWVEVVCIWIDYLLTIKSGWSVTKNSCRSDDDDSWGMNTIPSPFDLPSLFVFPWPILEASSHFYLSSCFGFTLITHASIAKSSLFGFGQKYLESNWLLQCYPGLLLAQWKPSQIDST